MKYDPINQVERAVLNLLRLSRGPLSEGEMLVRYKRKLQVHGGRSVGVGRLVSTVLEGLATKSYAMKSSRGSVTIWQITPRGKAALEEL